jgi:hypothetical protein
MNNDNERRETAIHRLKAKRDFTTHVVVYVVVNAMLIGIWAVTDGGYFWPIWPILGWGVGLALNAWTVYGQKPISEQDIRAEMERNDPSGPTDP